MRVIKGKVSYRHNTVDESWIGTESNVKHLKFLESIASFQVNEILLGDYE